MDDPVTIPGPDDPPEAERRRRAQVLTAPRALAGLLDGTFAHYIFDDETTDRMMAVQFGTAHAAAMDCLRHTTQEAEDNPAGRATELSFAIRLMAVGARLMAARLRLKGRPGGSAPRRPDDPAPGEPGWYASLPADADGFRGGFRFGHGPKPPGFNIDDPKTWTGPIRAVWATGPAPIPPWQRPAGGPDDAVFGDAASGDPVRGDAVQRENP